MLSYWEKKYFFREADIVVIGAGYTGLSAAYHLAKKFPKRKITIIEKGQLPNGASTKNAGFACFGSLSEIISDLKKNEEKEVFDLVQKRIKGIEKILELFSPSIIDYRQKGSYELFGEKELVSYENCMNKLDDVNQILRHISGENTFQAKDSALEQFQFEGYAHAVYSQYEGMLNPVLLTKCLIDLCKTLNIEFIFGFKLTKHSLSGHCVNLVLNDEIQMKCQQLVFASNGFSAEFLDLDLEPARAQVLITEPLKCLKFDTTFHMQEGYYYFRNIDNRILLGGGRNLDFEEEKTTEFDTTKLIQSELIALLKSKIIPNQDVKIAHSWSGIMAVGQSKMPIVKQLNDRQYCAVRLGGMGVAIGVSTGEAVANLVH